MPARKTLVTDAITNKLAERALSHLLDRRAKLAERALSHLLDRRAKLAQRIYRVTPI